MSCGVVCAVTMTQQYTKHWNSTQSDLRWVWHVCGKYSIPLKVFAWCCMVACHAQCIVCVGGGQGHCLSQARQS
jgi:hypothetical protein